MRDSIRLDSISEKIRPALGVSQGDFLVGADQNTEDFQKYGEIAYKTVDLEGKKTTLYTFQPSGNQVHSFASDIVGKIWKVSNNINTKKIADTSYKKVVLPDGTKRLMMMHKMTNGNSRWVGFHEGTIYQLEGVNIVRKIGEANWRKVIISETEVVLFMSKKIEKNAEWIGAYNGKYYISQ